MSSRASILNSHGCLRKQCFRPLWSRWRSRPKTTISQRSFLRLARNRALLIAHVAPFLSMYFSDPVAVLCLCLSGINSWTLRSLSVLFLRGAVCHLVVPHFRWCYPVLNVTSVQSDAVFTAGDGGEKKIFVSTVPVSSPAHHFFRHNPKFFFTIRW